MVKTKTKKYTNRNKNLNSRCLISRTMQKIAEFSCIFCLSVILICGYTMRHLRVEKINFLSLYLYLYVHFVCYCIHIRRKKNMKHFFNLHDQTNLSTDVETQQQLTKRTTMAKFNFVNGRNAMQERWILVRLIHCCTFISAK